MEVLLGQGVPPTPTLTPPPQGEREKSARSKILPLARVCADFAAIMLMLNVCLGEQSSVSAQSAFLGALMLPCSSVFVSFLPRFMRSFWNHA